MSDPNARQISFVTRIMASSVNVNLTIRMNYMACFEFTLYGMPYSCNITHWSRRRFAEFGTLFFNHAARDLNIITQVSLV